MSTHNIRRGNSNEYPQHKFLWRNVENYRNDPKFSDRYAWANSADPGQTASRTVCQSVCIWTHYSMVEPLNSNFRVIKTNFLCVRIFRKFTVSLNYYQIPS